MCLGSMDPEYMPINAKPETPLYKDPDQQYLHQVLARDPWIFEVHRKDPELPDAAWVFLDGQDRVREAEEARFIAEADQYWDNIKFLKPYCPSWFEPKKVADWKWREWHIVEQSKEERKVEEAIKEFREQGGRKRDRQAVRTLLRKDLRLIRDLKFDVALLHYQATMYEAASTAREGIFLDEEDAEEDLGGEVLLGDLLESRKRDLSA